MAQNGLKRFREVLAVFGVGVLFGDKKLTSTARYDINSN